MEVGVISENISSSTFYRIIEILSGPIVDTLGYHVVCFF
jgi:hypothetical protein